MIKQPKCLPGKQAGLSLIELMIASVIGLVLLSGVVTIFTSNNASSKMATGMGRVQESGGVALDIMSYGLRMAGYQGCRDELKEPVQMLASAGPTINTAALNYPDNSVWGSEVDDSGSWSPARHPDLDAIPADMEVKPNTDVLYIRYASGNTIGLNAPMPNSGSNIVLPRNPEQLQTNDLIMISDCNVANVFRATDVTAQASTGVTTIQQGIGGNTQANLTQVYPNGSTAGAQQVEVMKFEAKAYFVAPSGRDLPGGDALHSLFELDTSALVPRPTELVEGVEDFQVLYGINLQTDEFQPPIIRYVTAENVVNPAQVISVQLGLIVATADYSAQDSDNQIYNIAGHRVGPSGALNIDSTHDGDRRIRAAFNTAVQVRNRLQ